MKVSEDHYLQVPEELYRKLAQTSNDSSPETTKGAVGVSKGLKLQKTAKRHRWLATERKRKCLSIQNIRGGARTCNLRLRRPKMNPL